MLRIKKETVEKTKLELEVNSALKKELDLYLKVAKANSYIDKSATLSDLIEEALNQLVANDEYKSLKADYKALAEARKEKMRLAKAKQRAKAKELIEKPMSKNAMAESLAHSEGTKPHKGNKNPNK